MGTPSAPTTPRRAACSSIGSIPPLAIDQAPTWVLPETCPPSAFAEIAWAAALQVGRTFEKPCGPLRKNFAGPPPGAPVESQRR